MGENLKSAKYWSKTTKECWKIYENERLKYAKKYLKIIDGDTNFYILFDILRDFLSNLWKKRLKIIKNIVKKLHKYIKKCRKMIKNQEKLSQIKWKLT